jgi:GH25 family lysozyme M1 (1,4-beta-N-acetylmuramidase)
MSRPVGIDVSHWQGVIDWNAVEASGVSFAYVKATEGFTFDDPRFVENMTNGANAGVKVGGYHFARPDNQPNALDEVQHYLQVAGPYIQNGYLVPALDVENPVAAGDVIDTKAEMSQWVNDWCNGVYGATGVRPIIYTSANYAANYLDDTVAQWDVWMRSINAQDPQIGAPTTTAPWPYWTLWQHAVQPGVPGIAGDVDRNVYNGDLASFERNMVISPPEISISGVGMNIPNNHPTPIDFGTVTEGSTPPTVYFKVYNTGGRALMLSNLTLPTGFTLVEPLNSVIAAGTADKFTVALDTATVGTKFGDITITTNDADENPFSFPITGTVNPVVVPATISGMVFNDANGDGVRQIGEAGMSGWNIYIDRNLNGAYDAGEPLTTTNLKGGWQFQNLRPGFTYRVSIVPPPLKGGGWRLTTPRAGYFDVTPLNGQTVTGLMFGVRKTLTFPFPSLIGESSRTIWS